MYGGGSSKLGRLGGGGGGGGPSKNRKSFPLPPPSHRAPSSGRLSLGGNAPRGLANQSKNNSLSTPASKQPIEESFSLVSGNNPLAFGMIIKLTPDLLDEIRRAEAQGETAKMKFDSNNSSPGNVINVGTKDFKFTWSREMGDLCDIYEERQTGEDGNGLLVESGSTWRKLSVQRILDESITNHVKMRSEEAERKNKSRKAIVLEPGNPSKSQVKALAGAECTPWKVKHKKDPPPKKRKVDPSQGSNPLTFSSKTPSSTTPSVRTRPSSSPLPSSPLLSGNPTSPFTHQSASKNQTMVEDAMHAQPSGKERISSSEKDLATRGASKARETIEVKGKSETIPSDLRTMLVSLLMDNPKGMSLKALELAVGNMFFNPVKKMEPILKKIATFQAPGKYMLRKDIDFESLKKPSSDDRSPHEDSHKAHHPEDTHGQNPVSDPRIENGAFGVENREDAQLDSKFGEENNVLERNDTRNSLPDLFGEKEGSDKSEGQVASSSNSGSDSDSDSDSSDSGSDSSSDSESDDSSNSKEGSDEDVDIMTSDDDKEQKNKLESFDEEQDQYRSMKVEVEKILPDDDQESEMVVVVDDDPIREAEKHVVEANGSSINNELHKEHQSFIETLFNEKEGMVEDGYNHDQSNRYERISDSRSKRGFGTGTSDEKFDHGKRLKDGSLPQPSAWSNDNEQLAKSSHLSSPERRDLESHKDLAGRVDKDGRAEFRIGQEHNRTIVGNSAGYSKQFNQRVDDVGRGSASDVAGGKEQVIERFSRGPKYSGRNSDVQERDIVQEGKDYYEKQAEDEHNKDEKEPRGFQEGGNRNKHPVLSDSQSKRHGDIGKSKEAGLISKSHKPRKDDRRSSVNGRDKILQRELSDLELGEFRDPAPQEISKSKKQSDKASFKKSESKPSVPDRQDINFGNGRPVGKDTLDSGKALPSYLGGEASGYPEDSSKKRTPERYAGEITRPQHQTPNSQPLQQSKVHRAEVDKGTPLSVAQHDPKNGQVPTIKKHKNMRRSSTPADSINGGKEFPVPEPKRRVSSDEISSLYYKYEKEAPELKGPIKDQSQYEEYLREYAVEYDCYVSLAETIETECERFRKLGKDIEKVKPGDTENYNRVVGRLRESYLQSGSSHKRLKKIFNVVHKELVNLKQRMKEFAVLQDSS